MIEVLAWISPMAITMCLIFGFVTRQKEKEVQKWKRKYEDVLEDTDFQRLCRKYDVRRVKCRETVTDRELHDAGDPAAHLVRARHASIRGVIEALVDDGYFRFSRQDMPASPKQEWEASIMVVDPRGEERKASYDGTVQLSSTDLFQPRNETEEAA